MDDATAQRAIDRFVGACQRDPAVLAGCLDGSRAAGTADGHSDIDLGIITTDQRHDRLWADRAKFTTVLGGAVFLEDFDIPGTLFRILLIKELGLRSFVIPADGTGVGLALGRENDFLHMAPGPIRALVDKPGLLSGVTFQEKHPDPGEQRETLRRLIAWFWHDVSHFITAVARGHSWWAHGQLEMWAGIGTWSSATSCSRPRLARPRSTGRKRSGGPG